MKLLFNAVVHTLDETRSQASAVLIDGARILAIGERDELRNLAHGKLEQQDLKGSTILPGLTDAHIHIQHYSLSLEKIDCETKTKDECLRRVADRLKNAKPGQWILGHGWNQNEWSAGGEWPTA